MEMFKNAEKVISRIVKVEFLIITGLFFFAASFAKKCSRSYRVLVSISGAQVLYDRRLGHDLLHFLLWTFLRQVVTATNINDEK